MKHGYATVEVDSEGKAYLEEYMKENYNSWIQHTGERSLPLIFVYASYKTKTWSRAAATLPVESAKDAVAELKLKTGEDGSSMYHWQPTLLGVIWTGVGPSSAERKTMASFLAEHPIHDAEFREGLEECQCVAIKAFTVMKKASLWGTRASKYGGSRRTVTSASSRRTIQNPFRSIATLLQNSWNSGT